LVRFDLVLFLLALAGNSTILSLSVIHIAIQVGNCYTGAVFVNLLSLICGAGQEALLGKRIGVFSYGSGSVRSGHEFLKAAATITTSSTTLFCLLVDGTYYASFRHLRLCFCLMCYVIKSSMDTTLPSLLLPHVSPCYLPMLIFFLVAMQVATFYSLRCRQPSPAEEGKSSPSSSSAFTLARIQETVGLRARLEQTRKTVTAEEFTQVLLASLLYLVHVLCFVVLREIRRFSFWIPTSPLMAFIDCVCV